MPYAAALLAGLFAFAAAPPADALPARSEMIAADEAALRSAGVASDGPALLAHLRKHTLSVELRATAQQLIAHLADDSFQTREKASGTLLQMGPVIVPLLRNTVATTDDLEQRRRANRLIDQLEPLVEPAVASAAIRLLAVRKPAGATAALLAFLPDALEDNGDEVLAALAVVACPRGEPDKEIVAALADAEPIRRAAAAEVVGRSLSKRHAPAVLKLLADKDATVRTRAALALAFAREKKAIPVLIELTAELPVEQRGWVDDALFQLAADDAPTLSVGDSAEARKQRRDAWSAWWSKRRDTVDLARFDRDRMRGTLCVILEHDGTMKVTELSRNDKPMWTIKGLPETTDARIISGNRVLLAESRGARVTERTFDGTVLWEYKCLDPILAQRLSNGNTFITTKSGVVEVDRAGKKVYSRKVAGLRSAHKYRDGRIALVIGRNEYQRLSPLGNLEAKYPIDLEIDCVIGGIDFLPDFGLLAVRTDRVVRYNASGKEVWRAIGLSGAYCPTRLSNGHTLVACTGTKQFIEFDPAGKMVRKIPGGFRPWLARGR